MSHRGRKSADSRLAAAIASGLTLRAASKRAGVSERTAGRRMQDREFVASIAKMQAETTGRTLGILTKAATKAARKLQNLIDNSDRRISLRACVAIIREQARLRHAANFDERLLAVEEMAKGLK